MITYNCDKCGMEIEDNPWEYFIFRKHPSDFVSRDDRIILGSAHLCSKCAAELFEKGEVLKLDKSG